MPWPSGSSPSFFLLFSTPLFSHYLIFLLFTLAPIIDTSLYYLVSAKAKYFKRNFLLVIVVAFFLSLYFSSCTLLLIEPGRILSLLSPLAIWSPFFLLRAPGYAFALNWWCYISPLLCVHFFGFRHSFIFTLLVVIPRLKLIFLAEWLFFLGAWNCVFEFICLSMSLLANWVFVSFFACCFFRFELLVWCHRPTYWINSSCWILSVGAIVNVVFAYSLYFAFSSRWTCW